LKKEVRVDVSPEKLKGKICF